MGTEIEGYHGDRSPHENDDAMKSTVPRTLTSFASSFPVLGEELGWFHVEA